MNKMDESVFEVLVTPIKSESDKKDYKVIKLKNDLIACIISNPGKISQESENEIGDEENKKESEEKKAAAMLCIGVGSYSDPKEIQGMAHFLEHMVFMGSEKYPTENDFSSFISKRGGTYNAFTTEETTCFYFDCLEKHLKESLDRFAQFFIAPLLKKEAMTREREAVDSEFQMASVSDYPRKEQLYASLAKEESPVNCFGYGNLKTLKDNIEDDELHQAVNFFREKHYSAHRMTLAILSRLPMENLQNLVLENFSNVPNNSIPKEDFATTGMDIFATPKFNRIYYIKPIDETIELDLKWSVPSLYYRYKTKSLYYCAFLLGYEGKGSLLSYFKKHVWATSFSSWGDERSIYSIFSCHLTLTEEGFKHLFDIIEAIFSYINLVRKSGPQEHLHQDIKAIDDTAFKFATEDEAAWTVINLYDPMHRYPSEHFLTGSKLHYEFDPDEISTIVEHLVPSNVNILVANKNLPDGLKFVKTEKWFRAEYVDVPIPDDLKTKWKSVEPYPEFEIPPPNLYLTKDFKIVPEEPNHPEYPQKIAATEKYELWYRQDQKFKLPLAHYCFFLMTPIFNESPKNVVLTELFTTLVSFCMDEEVYPATIAKLSNCISFYNKGISIQVDGYNEKLPALIEVISKYITNLSDYITEKMFLGLKEHTLKNEYNIIRSPNCLVNDSYEKLLIKSNWSHLEKYNELLNLSYADILQFIDSYKKELYVKVLVQGNVLQEVARNTVNSFIDSLQFDPLPEDDYPKVIASKVPIGEKCIYLESFNKEDVNSVIENYYQVGPYRVRDSVIIDLIMLIIEEAAFDILRTKEQLGYSVYCASRETQSILGYVVAVTTQAHKFSTEYVDTRIEDFINHSRTILEGTTVDGFQHVKEDYIKTKECVDVQLGGEVDRNWNEITTDDYMFDRMKREVKIANEITLDEVKNWWDRHNHYGGKENYRKISFQVLGHVQDEKINNTEDKLYGKPISLIYLGNNEEHKKDDPEYFIENIDEFNDKLEKYPVRLMKKGP